MAAKPTNMITTRKGFEEYIARLNNEKGLKERAYQLCEKMVQELGTQYDKDQATIAPLRLIHDKKLHSGILEKADKVAQYMSFLGTVFADLKTGIEQKKIITSPNILGKGDEKNPDKVDAFTREGDKIASQAFTLATFSINGLIAALEKADLDHFIEVYRKLLSPNFYCVRDPELVLSYLQYLFFYYVVLAKFLPIGITLRMDNALAELAWTSGVYMEALQSKAYDHNLNIKRNIGKAKGRKADNRNLIDNAIHRMKVNELMAMDKHPYARASKIRDYISKQSGKTPPAINTVIKHWNEIAKERGWK